MLLEEPPDGLLVVLPNRDADVNDKRSLLLRNPDGGGPALAFEEHEENRPPTTDGPPPTPPVDPDKTFGADVLRPSIGVGSAGLIKRSLARRF